MRSSAMSEDRKEAGKDGERSHYALEARTDRDIDRNEHHDGESARSHIGAYAQDDEDAADELDISDEVCEERCESKLAKEADGSSHINGLHPARSNKDTTDDQSDDKR